MRQRNNAGGNEERKGPIEYPERDPLDLIEEDKRPFARRKLLATCCGGYRTVYDEVTAQSLHPALLAIQFLTYMFFPGLIMLSIGVLWPDQNRMIGGTLVAGAWPEGDDRMISGAFVAGVAFVVCSALQISSFLLKRGDMAREAANEAKQGQQLRLGLRGAANLRQNVPTGTAALNMVDAGENSGFFSKKTYYFLVPPKASCAELVTVLVLAPLYGFLATYLCRSTDETLYRTLTLIVVFFSSYSLLSLPIPEVTPYGTDDSFSVFSHHYQRIYYQVALSGVLLIAEKSFDNLTVVSLLVPDIYWANLIILLLQMVGWLSNPFVTILYALEQTEILLFGGTARASDSRIIISFLVNTAVVVVFTKTELSTNAELTVVYAVVALITSKNYLHSLGLKKPFKIENEEMMRQKVQADIVFANLEVNPNAEDQKRKEI